MPHTIAERVKRWSASTDATADFLDLQQQVEFLGRQVFGSYGPTSVPGEPFILRLRNWLDSTPDESEQQLMFKLVSSLLFLRREDYFALYRSAFKGVVMRWLVEQLNLRLDDAGAEQQLETAINRTWFCPVTDSMQIADFHHVNHIQGRDLRPDWRSLALLGAYNKVADHMRTESIDFVVLLEDFVATGTQARDVLPLIAAVTPTPVLLLPLVICPDAVTTLSIAATGQPNLKVMPLVTIPESAFVAVTTARRPAFLAELELLAPKVHDAVCGSAHWRMDTKPYGPFGWGEKGAVVVIHSNCPDNTLPLIHHSSSTWSPVFPRSSRV
jgi:hypothetical protein